MQAVILAGGEGTRLRPLTETVPKTTLPLCGRPFTAYTIDWLERFGVDEVVLSCGYLADETRAALADVSGPRLVFETEPEPLGTAGAIGHCRESLGERFFALNGDVLSDLDLSALVDAHERSGARATIALYPVDDVSSYGLVERRPDGRITAFLEKPDPGEASTDEINAGVYLLDHSVLDLIEPGREVSIERDVFPILAEEGSLQGVRLDGYWLDIGTPERFLQASWDILEGRVRTSVGEVADASGVTVDPEARVDGSAQLVAPCLVGSDCTVDAGARLGPRCVVGPGCSIGARSTVEDSVLLAGCEVGEGAAIEGAILSACSTVPVGSAVAAGTVSAEGQTLGEEGTS